MSEMEIAEVARPSGLPASTLRFYEETRLIASKADELDQTIRELTAMRDGLRQAAACRAPSHMEYPSFRRILRAASTGAPGSSRRKPPVRSSVRGADPSEPR